MTKTFRDECLSSNPKPSQLSLRATPNTTMPWIHHCCCMLFTFITSDRQREQIIDWRKLQNSTYCWYIKDKGKIHNQ